MPVPVTLTPGWLLEQCHLLVGRSEDSESVLTSLGVPEVPLIVTHSCTDGGGGEGLGLRWALDTPAAVIGLSLWRTTMAMLVCRQVVQLALQFSEPDTRLHSDRLHGTKVAGGHAASAAVETRTQHSRTVSMSSDWLTWTLDRHPQERPDATSADGNDRLWVHARSTSSGCAAEREALVARRVSQFVSRICGRARVSGLESRETSAQILGQGGPRRTWVDTRPATCKQQVRSSILLPSTVPAFQAP